MSLMLQFTHPCPCTLAIIFTVVDVQDLRDGQLRRVGVDLGRATTAGSQGFGVEFFVSKGA